MAIFEFALPAGNKVYIWHEGFHLKCTRFPMAKRGTSPDSGLPDIISRKQML